MADEYDAFQEVFSYSLRPSLLLLSPPMWQFAPGMMPALVRRLRLEARWNTHAAMLLAWARWANARWAETHAEPLVVRMD